jgi:hypothetical protein
MLDVIDKKLNQGDIVGFKLFEYVTHRGIPKREVLRSLVLYIEECPIERIIICIGTLNRIGINRTARKGKGKYWIGNGQWRIIFP